MGTGLSDVSEGRADPEYAVMSFGRGTCMVRFGRLWRLASLGTLFAAVAKAIEPCRWKA
jgi:hypothetical protein